MHGVQHGACYPKVRGGGVAHDEDVSTVPPAELGEVAVAASQDQGAVVGSVRRRELEVGSLPA